LCPISAREDGGGGGAATKRFKTLGTLTIQASFLLAKRQASAGVMREVAAQLQAERAAAAEATEVARHDACALRQPDEPLAVKVGNHLTRGAGPDRGAGGGRQQLKGTQPLGCGGCRRGG